MARFRGVIDSSVGGVLADDARRPSHVFTAIESRAFAQASRFVECYEAGDRLRSFSGWDEFVRTALAHLIFRASAGYGKRVLGAAASVTMQF
jgi:hypothetical protein